MLKSTFFFEVLIFTALFSLLLLVLPNSILAQTNPLDFFPHHVGDVWQYRSLYTGQLVGTIHIDSITVDSLSRDTFIYYRRGGRFRIDSSANVYNMDFQSEYPRYKLTADSGESWIAGYDIINGDTLRTYIISVSDIFYSYLFGVYTTIKVFRFEMINPCCGPFWLGNEYLAAGFGVVAIDIEPSDSYYLSGAIINYVQYGVIVGVSEQNQLIPQEFNLYQNYPNPFNAGTTIRYYLPTAGFVVLKVYDLLGREISTLVNSYQLAGEHQVFFTPDNIPSGVYYYKLNFYNQLQTRKFTYVK